MSLFAELQAACLDITQKGSYPACNERGSEVVTGESQRCKGWLAGKETGGWVVCPLITAGGLDLRLPARGCVACSHSVAGRADV